MNYIIYTNSKGEKYEVRIEIDTKDQKVNITSADFYFDKNELTLNEIREDKTIVPMWVKKPELKENVISFAGMIPGGYDGIGTVVTFVFDKKDPSISNPKIELKNIQTLKNDGNGTEIKSTVLYKKTDISVLDNADNIKPEAFKPVIYQYEGIYYIAFSTTDKGSGIKNYQIKESGEWKIIQSPYELRNQKLTSFISIKAVDNAGNEYISKINPQNIPLWSVICAIIVGIIVLYTIWKRVYSKNNILNKN